MKLIRGNTAVIKAAKDHHTGGSGAGVSDDDEEEEEEEEKEEEEVENLTGSDSALEIVLALLDGDTFHGSLILNHCSQWMGCSIDSGAEPLQAGPD